jgi:hypothetical protein
MIPATQKEMIWKQQFEAKQSKNTFNLKTKEKKNRCLLIKQIFANQ